MSCRTLHVVMLIYFKRLHKCFSLELCDSNYSVHIEWINEVYFQHNQTKQKISVELVMLNNKMLKKGQEGSVILIILALLLRHSDSTYSSMLELHYCNTC